MMTAAMCQMLVIMIRGEGGQVMPALIQISMTHRDHNTVIMSSFSRKYREEVFDNIFSSYMRSKGGFWLRQELKKCKCPFFCSVKSALELIIFIFWAQIKLSGLSQA